MLRDPAILREIAGRFAHSCCGRIRVTNKDLETLGCWPLPVVYDVEWGRIIPSSGWQAKCIYVYEQISSKRFPDFRRTPGARVPRANEMVGAELRRIADEIEAPK